MFSLVFTNLHLFICKGIYTCMANCVVDVHLNMLAAVSKKEKFILLQDKIEVKKASFGAR